MQPLYERILDYLFEGEHTYKDLYEHFKEVERSDVKEAAKELEIDKYIKVKSGQRPKQPDKLEVKIILKGTQYVQDKKQKATPAPTSRLSKTALIFGIIVPALLLSLAALTYYGNFLGNEPTPPPVIDLCPYDKNLKEESFGFFSRVTKDNTYYDNYYFKVCNSASPAFNVKIQFYLFSRVDKAIFPHLRERNYMKIDTAKLADGASVRLKFPFYSFIQDGTLTDVFITGKGTYQDDKEKVHDFFLLKRFNVSKKDYEPLSHTDSIELEHWLRQFKMME